MQRQHADIVIMNGLFFLFIIDGINQSIVMSFPAALDAVLHVEQGS